MPAISISSLSRGRALSALFSAVFLAASAGNSSAAAISLNFASGSGEPAATFDMASGEVAGVVPLSNWNNLHGPSNTVTGLLGETGAPTTAAASWTSNGTHDNIFLTVSPGNFTMMKSHLDARASGFGSPEDATVTVSSLPAGIANLYDVYVYFDAVTDNGLVFANYTIGATTFYIQDTSNFTGTFVQGTGTTPDTRTAGANYVKFSGLTGDSFTLVADSENFRAEISGIQIVAVPEPGGAGLAALGALALARRRRRRTAVCFA